MFSVIEFKQSADGGGLSIVNSEWVTPRKQEVYWPPIKNKTNFNNILRKHHPEIDEQWKLYAIEKIFYTTDDFEKAKEKLKTAEVTSDLQTDLEECNVRSRRRIIAKRKFSSDSDSDSQVSPSKSSGKCVQPSLARPPPVKIKITPTNVTGSPQQLEVEAATRSNAGSEYTDPILQDTSCTPRRHLHQLSTPNSEIFGPNFSRITAINQTPTLNSSTNLENTLQDKNAFMLLLNNVLKIKAQNRQILDILQKSSVSKNAILPDDVPVRLPVESLDDLETLETYLAHDENFNHFKSYYTSISNGDDIIQKNNRILRSLLTDAVAKNFNYFGTNRQKKEFNKKPFNQLLINKVVIDAVKHGSNFTTQQVENAIKCWLKHAPSRKKKNKDEH